MSIKLPNNNNTNLPNSSNTGASANTGASRNTDGGYNADFAMILNSLGFGSADENDEPDDDSNTPYPGMERVPDLYNIKRVNKVSQYLTKDFAHLDSEFIKAFKYDVIKDYDQPLQTSLLAQTKCVNIPNWNELLANFLSFNVVAFKEKFVLCRTVSNENSDLIGFDFCIFKDMNGDLVAYVPFAGNTLSDDMKLLKISDYVDQNSMMTEEEFLYYLGFDNTVAIQDCSLAIKKFGSCQMSLKDFGVVTTELLEKSISNNNGLAQDFIYAGRIKANDSAATANFIDSYGLIPAADIESGNYELYVKVGDFAFNKMHGLKKIINKIDFNSDAINNINIEAQNGILFIRIPIMNILGQQI